MTIAPYGLKKSDTNRSDSQLLLLLRIAAAHQSTPNDQVRLSINV